METMTEDDLTTADRFELETATLTTHEDEIDDYVEDRDDATINRWTNHGHDRLYINDGFDDFYVDLKTGTVEGISGRLELTGNTLTVTYTRHSVRKYTYEYKITVEGGDFESESHECEECGDEFDSEHGLAVHEGIKHNETKETDGENATTTATETDETPTVACDGGETPDGTDLPSFEELQNAETGDSIVYFEEGEGPAEGHTGDLVNVIQPDSDTVRLEYLGINPSHILFAWVFERQDDGKLTARRERAEFSGDTGIYDWTDMNRDLRSLRITGPSDRPRVTPQYLDGRWRESDREDLRGLREKFDEPHEGNQWRWQARLSRKYHAESESNDTDTDGGLVSDGGDDATSHIQDSEIEDVRQRLGDPDHPAELSISEYRTLLADLQAQLVDGWSEYLDAVSDSNASIVYEDRDVVVLADHDNADWDYELGELDYESDVTGEVLKGIHHVVAGRLCEYSWESADPLVVAKTDGWKLGETHVEHRIAQIATEADVSEARAYDYYQVEIRGWSQSAHARFVGKDQSTVSQAIDRVEAGLEYSRQ